MTKSWAQDIVFEVLKFINDRRQFDVASFYEKLRKNHNDKKSPLYKNIVSDIEAIADTVLLLKNGKIIKNGSIMKTSSKVAEQYAAQMKDEIKARMNDISDDTVEASYTKIVAHPTTLNLIAETMSELALKKFVEKNVNGKTVEVSVILDIIKENPIKNGDLKDYSYYAFSHIEDNVDFTKYSRINIYSNNDKLLTSKIDSIYKAKGTVEVSFDIIGEMSYQITE